MVAAPSPHISYKMSLHSWLFQTLHADSISLQQQLYSNFLSAGLLAIPAASAAYVDAYVILSRLSLELQSTWPDFSLRTNIDLSLRTLREQLLRTFPYDGPTLITLSDTYVARQFAISSCILLAGRTDAWGIAYRVWQVVTALSSILGTAGNELMMIFSDLHAASVSTMASVLPSVACAFIARCFPQDTSTDQTTLSATFCSVGMQLVSAANAVCRFPADPYLQRPFDNVSTSLRQKNDQVHAHKTYAVQYRAAVRQALQQYAPEVPRSGADDSCLKYLVNLCGGSYAVWHLPQDKIIRLAAANAMCLNMLADAAASWDPAVEASLRALVSELESRVPPLLPHRPPPYATAADDAQQARNALIRAVMSASR